MFFKSKVVLSNVASKGDKRADDYLWPYKYAWTLLMVVSLTFFPMNRPASGKELTDADIHRAIQRPARAGTHQHRNGTGSECRRL